MRLHDLLPGAALQDGSLTQPEAYPVQENVTTVFFGWHKDLPQRWHKDLPQPTEVAGAGKDQQTVAVKHKVVHVTLNDHSSLQKIGRNAELAGKMAAREKEERDYCFGVR